MLDADDDGKINAKDLQEALGDEFDINEINSIIQEVDRDGTKSVSMREFTDAMMEKDTSNVSSVARISGVSAISGISAISALSASNAPNTATQQAKSKQDDEKSDQ